MKAVADFMTKKIAAIAGEATVLEAAMFMKKKGTGSLMVKEGKKFVGIFTERDLLNKLNRTNAGRLAQLKVRELMTSRLKTIDYQEPYTKAIAFMKQHRIRHIPVVKNAKIVGIVSLRDLLEHYDAALRAEIRLNVTRIKDSEMRFRTVFNNSAVGITLADKDERIIAWNPFVASLLGMDKELRNKPIQELYPADEWKRMRTLNIRKLGMKHQLETKILHKDGHLIEVAVSISVLKNAKGGIIGSIGVITDITERKERERELQEMYDKLKETQVQLIQSQKIATLGQFSVGIAHEVKTPLAVIMQGMEALSRKIPTDEPQNKRYCKMIENAVQKISNVITELLHLSRSSELNLEVIDLHKVIDSAMLVVHNKAKLGDIAFHRRYESAQSTIYGDSILLETVFLNLFANAVDAMEAGGEITVTTRLISASKESPAPKIAVEVADTGTGMPKEVMEHIFDPFYTTKQTGVGTGLGLSMVHLILERHNAAISVASRENKGTTFTVEFALH